MPTEKFVAGNLFAWFLWPCTIDDDDCTTAPNNGINAWKSQNANEKFSGFRLQFPNKNEQHQPQTIRSSNIRRRLNRQIEYFMAIKSEFVNQSSKLIVRVMAITICICYSSIWFDCIAFEKGKCQCVILKLATAAVRCAAISIDGESLSIHELIHLISFD